MADKIGYIIFMIFIFILFYIELKIENKENKYDFRIITIIFIFGIASFFRLAK